MAATMRAAARSAKFGNFLVNRAIFSLNRRTYLSAQYGCEKEWDETKEKDPMLKNVERERLLVDIVKRLGNKSEQGIALDVDIFVNSLKPGVALDELENTLNKFRRSKYCASALPSTTPAVIRYCLQNGLEDNLISFFEDRLNYGLFPDTQTLNFMLDNFLTRGMYRNAAKVAVHFALQEDPGNAISKTLSLIACIKYLSQGKEAAPWKEQVVAEKGEEEDDDDEIEYVRVPNITNPWFDDHFDLDDPNDLIGKTLLFFGQVSEGIVRDSVILIGLARRQRWDEFKKTLASVKEVSNDTKYLCLERLSLSNGGNAEEAGEEAAAENATESEQAPADAAPTENLIPDWVEGELSKLKINSKTLIEVLEEDVKNLKSVEEADIKILRDNIASFIERRQAELAEKNWQLERQERFEILKQKKLELVQKEELLYAFENWNKIEMLLQEVLDERGEEVKEEEKEYIPAQINRRHQVAAKTPENQS